MGFLGNLLSATVKVATTPIDIVKDVVTLGGTCEGEDEPYTLKKLKSVAEDVGDACSSAKDGDLI